MQLQTDLFGATGFTGGTDGATVINTASPLVSGEFGTFSEGDYFSTGYSGSITNLGSGEAAMANPHGYFAASFELGNGRAALFTDEEIFMNKTVSGLATANLTENSAQIFLNSFDYISENASAPVPIPGAVWLLGSGLAGLVGLRRKKK